MPIQIQYRRDTSTNWTSQNPTLLAGEPGYETDTGKYKIGDGSTAWTSLVYYGANGAHQNIFEVYTWTGSAASWTVPTTLRFDSTAINPGRWKVTLIGGGGSGGGTGTVAGNAGNGGGSGAVCIGYYTYVSGQNTMSYSIGGLGPAQAASASGVAGTSTTTTYNSVTYTAGGGSGGSNVLTANGGGAGGTATGGVINLTGAKGDTGGSSAATLALMGYGGNTPNGWGWGGTAIGTAAGGAGIAATGFGAGGTGARNGTGVTGLAGGAGAHGYLVIEY